MITHFVLRSATDFLLTTTWRGSSEAASGVSDDRRLDAAITWLGRSIDVCGGRASSKGYRFLKGWMPPYPETSGYIIPTLLTIANESGDSREWTARAEAIAGWLIEIQLPGGGFRGREVGVLEEPDVFDTGMILLGFNALIHDGAGPAIREAADRAATFLAGSMDDTGCFVRNLSHGLVHAYNVRAAWGLVAYGLLSKQPRFVDAGMANARWTCGQQSAAGTYASNAFKPGGNANTHGIAYIMQGLLQIHDLTADQDAFDSVVRAARAVQERYRQEGWIAAEIGPDWQYLSRHICLTGYAQLAIVLLRLFELTADASFRHTAGRLLADAARTQDVGRETAPYYGAIAGSFPIYGRYAPLQYPNWATKFFIDALISKRTIERGEDRLPFLLYGS